MKKNPFVGRGRIEVNGRVWMGRFGCFEKSKRWSSGQEVVEAMYGMRGADFFGRGWWVGHRIVSCRVGGLGGGLIRCGGEECSHKCCYCLLFRHCFHPRKRNGVRRKRAARGEMKRTTHASEWRAGGTTTTTTPHKPNIFATKCPRRHARRHKRPFTRPRNFRNKSSKVH